MPYSCTLHIGKDIYLVAIIDESSSTIPLLQQLRSLAREYAKEEVELGDIINIEDSTLVYSMEFTSYSGDVARLIARPLTTWKVGMYKLEGDMRYRF